MGGQHQRRFRMGAQVLIPGGMVRLSPIGGNDYNLVVIAQTNHRYSARLTALGSNRSQPDHRQTQEQTSDPQASARDAQEEQVNMV